MANCEQELLLLGLRDAIMDNNNTAQIRISSDVCNELPMRLTLCTGQNPDGSQQLTTYEWGLPVGETGGGCTSPSEKAGCFFIGISDALSNNRGCTTGQYFKNEFGCIDILYTGSASSTFFHEVLDEFLNFYIRGNTTDQISNENENKIIMSCFDAEFCLHIICSRRKTHIDSTKYKRNFISCSNSRSNRLLQMAN